MAISPIHRGPQAVEGVVQYKPSPAQQKVIDMLSSPTAAAVLVPLIPKGVDLTTVATEVYRVAAENPDILKCTETSVVLAVSDCLRAELIIGKEVHLVPVNTKVSKDPEKYELRCQAWNDYKGDIALVRRSGAARNVVAEAVYENDLFEPHLGTEQFVRHIPPIKGPRGKMIGAYAIAFITNTMNKVKWMPLEEIEAIRAKSKSWSPKRVQVCPDWYAKKTAIHAVTKDLPKNPKLARVLAMFEHQEAIDRAEEAEYTIETPAQREGQVAPRAAEHRAPSGDEPPSQASEPSYDAHGESDRAVTRESESANEAPAVPNCPKCGGAMYDNRAENDKRAAGGQRLWPDFKCKDRQSCDGLYWRGQWPPEDEGQDSFRF